MEKEAKLDLKSLMELAKDARKRIEQMPEWKQRELFNFSMRFPSSIYRQPIPRSKISLL